MNTPLPHAPDSVDPIEGFNRKALLGLAVEPTAISGAPAYRVPDIAELNELFPDLEVIELVGTGGMGCVFKARQSKLDRFVAIKILPSDFSSDRLIAERFGREARAMARLNHPNIASVHDFGSVGDLHYLVMEYMDGMNLREWLDASDMNPQMALGVFTQICGALAYAHEEGVVHRDIKPENILFNKQGHVALADFGLARLAMDSNCEFSITQTRQAMGTLNYMAPEQYEDPKSVDHRADIFAMGVLLYELLTGKVPRGSFPPPSALCEVDASIDQVVNTALQVNPEDRFHTVDEMAAAVCGEPSLDRVGYGFAENGTFTNLRNIAATPFRMIAQMQSPSPPAKPDPKPERAPQPAELPPTTQAAPDDEQKKSVFPSFGTFTLIATGLVVLLMFFPWSDRPDRETPRAILDAGAGGVPYLVIPALLGWLTWANYNTARIRTWQWCVLATFVLGYCQFTHMAKLGPHRGTNQRDLYMAIITVLIFVHMGRTIRVAAGPIVRYLKSQRWW